jgi:hypothetical protein
MFIEEKLTLEEKINAIQELGICSTCNHLDACVNNTENWKTIWFCEEFDNYIPPKPEVLDLRTVLSGKKTGNGKDDIQPFLGLCINCESVKTCVFPKPASGVWHCNEYL